jgi:hypothetical protein
VTKIAILDDYIGVALEYGDWSALPPDAEITVYREAIPPERLVDDGTDCGGGSRLFTVAVVLAEDGRRRISSQGLPRASGYRESAVPGLTMPAS